MPMDDQRGTGGRADPLADAADLPGQRSGSITQTADGSRHATILTHTRVRDGKGAAFASWQQRMSVLVTRATGFVSQQVIPADPPVQDDWVIIQRFASRDDAQAWLESPERAGMLAEVQPLLQGEDAISVMQDVPSAAPQTSTAVIRTRVVPGREDQFREWSAEVASMQSRMPGYIGTATQEPIPGVQDQWVTLLAFDSPAHLRGWLDSPDRAALLRKARAIMARTDTKLVQSGFEGWFDFRRPAGEKPPPWKFNYLILVGLYPIVMLEVLFLNNKLGWMSLAFGSLIGNIISVGILGWPVVAILSKVMGWWIQPPAGASRFTDLKGALVMLAVLVVLVAGFFLVVRYVGADAKVLRL